MARSPLKEGWLFFVYSSITLVNHCKNEVNLRCAFPKLKTTAKSVQTTAKSVQTTAKSVQTTAEVCADYTCSLYRLQLKSPESTTYL